METTTPGRDDEDEQVPLFEERKYIVFKTALLNLFKSCPMRNRHGTVALKESGTLLTITFTCSQCSHCLTWNSQPLLNKMPAGNLQMSAAKLFTGSLPAKVFHLFKALNLATYSENTYYRHQRWYLQPTIINAWELEQRDLLNQLSNLEGGLILAGDGRSDSPGHCAKYGGFNTIECRINKVIDVQVVQSNEVGNSARCENKGLQRTLTLLHGAGHAICAIITDRHKQNQAYLKQNHPTVTHYFDVWHVAKGITKKLAKLTKKAGMDKVGRWSKSIINHLHWVASSTPDGNGAEMLAKWQSLLNHLVNKHHNHSAIFPSCLHGPLPQDDRTKDWFIPTSTDYVALEKILHSSYLLKDVQKLSPCHQTSALEAFHRLIINFCPKHTSFSYLGMHCKLMLAAMHYNENVDREKLTDDSGRVRLKVCFPKAKKGEYSVRRMKADPTYGYVTKLMEMLFRNFMANPAAILQSLPERFREKPDPLAASYEHPTADEVMATYVSRYHDI